MSNVTRKLDSRLSGHFLEGVRFVLVGVLNTIVGYGTIFILQNFVGMDYRLANAGGYALGLINSFFWNKFWTFRSKRHLKQEIIPFLIVFGICYLLNLGSLILFVERFGIHEDIAQALSMAIYTLCGWLGNKFWTFRSNRDPIGSSTGKNGRKP